MHITVPHQPVGQPRPRAVRTKFGVRMYNKSTHPSELIKRFLAWNWKLSKNPKIEGPVTVWIYAWFARPKYAIRKTKPMPEYSHIKKPDSDNIAKLVMDGLACAWSDDCQVSDLIVSKRVCSGTNPGRIDVVLEWGSDD